MLTLLLMSWGEPCLWNKAVLFFFLLFLVWPNSRQCCYPFGIRFIFCFCLNLVILSAEHLCNTWMLSRKHPFEGGEVKKWHEDVLLEKPSLNMWLSTLMYAHLPKVKPGEPPKLIWHVLCEWSVGDLLVLMVEITPSKRQGSWKGTWDKIQGVEWNFIIGQ